MAVFGDGGKSGHGGWVQIEGFGKRRFLDVLVTKQLQHGGWQDEGYRYLGVLVSTLSPQVSQVAVLRAEETNPHIQETNELSSISRGEVDLIEGEGSTKELYLVDDLRV